MSLKLCASASQMGTLVLPKMTAPASRRRFTESASARAMLSRCDGAPHVVGNPATSKESFTVMGTPCNGPHQSPRASARSASRACLRTRGTSVATIAFTLGLKRSTRAR